MTNSSEEPLLELLRNTPEVPPTQGALLMKAICELNNKLDDIKLKLDISNEIGLELLERRKKEARPDPGALVRRYRNKPPSSIW